VSARSERAVHLLDLLAAEHPDAHIALDFTTPLELLVATILSAQCTDARVNMVTPALFALCRTPADYLALPQAELEELIRPTGFFRAKTDSLLKLGAALVERHDGQVPNRLDDLVRLPGVGRKTANVVLGNAFGVPGITVDTHVGRLVRRWRLTAEEDPVKAEPRFVGIGVPFTCIARYCRPTHRAGRNKSATSVPLVKVPFLLDDRLA